MQLDLLIRNASIRTMDATRPHARSVGVWQGRIVGLDEDVDTLDARRTIDAGRAVLLPAFIDAHTHLAWQGITTSSTDISTAPTVDAALEIIGAAAQNVAEQEWLDVVGYDQRTLGRHLTAADLDRVSGGRRLYVSHKSGHTCVVDSGVLAALPADELATVPGVERDQNGRPTGHFNEAAQRLPRAARLPYSVDELVKAISAAGRICAEQGITFCAEAGLGSLMFRHSPIEIAVYQRALETGQLPVRAQLMVAGELLRKVATATDDEIPRALDLGLRTGFGDDRLMLGAVKMWTDGGMMARTAALTDPYVGTDNRGELPPDLDEYRATVRAAHAAGWQLALHAIGDRAIDLVLDVVEQIQAELPRPTARHRIEHCGLVRPDQLTRISAAGLTAVTQASFVHEFGDEYARAMGPDRADWMYRGRSYLEHGIPLAGSSDRPVTQGAPLAAIAFMVHRTTSGGRVIGANEKLSVQQAVEAYTTEAARACQVEDRLGTLTPGKLADFVVLGTDPWHADPAEITDIPVLATLLGGEFTHTSDGFGS